MFIKLCCLPTVTVALLFQSNFFYRNLLCHNSPYHHRLGCKTVPTPRHAMVNWQVIWQVWQVLTQRPFYLITQAPDKCDISKGNVKWEKMTFCVDLPSAPFERITTNNSNCLRLYTILRSVWKLLSHFPS